MTLNEKVNALMRWKDQTVELGNSLQTRLEEIDAQLQRLTEHYDEEIRHEVIGVSE